MLAHLSLCADFALMLRCADGSVCGVPPPRPAAGAAAAAAVAPFAAAPAPPILACIYAPDATYQSMYHVPATSYMLQLQSATAAAAGTGSQADGGPVPALPPYALLAGLGTLLEDPSVGKVMMGVSKVRSLLLQLCGVNLQGALDVLLAHNLLAASAACDELQQQAPAGSGGPRHLKLLDPGAVPPGSDVLTQLAAVHNLTRAAGPSPTAKALIMQNPSCWLLRPLAAPLLEHAGAQVAALAELGATLHQQLSGGAGLRGLGQAQAELAAWLARLMQ